MNNDTCPESVLPDAAPATAAPSVDTETPDARISFETLLRQVEAMTEEAPGHELWLTVPVPLYPQELAAFSWCMPHVKVETIQDSETQTRLGLTLDAPSSTQALPASLHEAAMLLLTLQLSRAVCESEDSCLPKELLSLCVAALNQAAAPYYGRYVFVRNALRDPALFHEFRDQLQATGMTLHPGHSQQHRYDALQARLPGGNTLVDIGCGKATYLATLAKRYRRATGFEADPPTRGQAKHILKRAGLDHVRVFGAFDAEKFIPDFSHVLMTEVLEHMPLELARAALEHLAGQNASLMLFTVPNHRFNHHYGLPAGAARHWDHHWEPDEEEFERLMRDAFDASRWELTFEGMGDCVEGVSSGMLCTVVPAGNRAKSKFGKDSDLLASLLSTPKTPHRRRP